MKNRDMILRYLSDLMSEEEKKAFEEKLALDKELNAEYGKIVKKINALKIEPQTDEKYFVDMQLKVRNRIAQPKKKVIGGLGYSLAAIAALFLFFVFNGKTDRADLTLQKNENSIVFNQDELEEFGTETSLEDLAAEFSLTEYIEEMEKNISADEVEEYVDVELSNLPVELLFEDLQITNGEIDKIFDNLKNEQFL